MRTIQTIETGVIDTLASDISYTYGKILGSDNHTMRETAVTFPDDAEIYLAYYGARKWMVYHSRQTTSKAGNQYLAKNAYMRAESGLFIMRPGIWRTVPDFDIDDAIADRWSQASKLGPMKKLRVFNLLESALDRLSEPR